MNKTPTTNVRTICMSKRIGKHVTVFLLNGFQVKGELLSSDETGLALQTMQYNDSHDFTPKEVFIPAHAYSTVI